VGPVLTRSPPNPQAGGPRHLALKNGHSQVEIVRTKILFFLLSYVFEFFGEYKIKILNSVKKRINEIISRNYESPNWRLKQLREKIEVTKETAGTDTRMF
jgi:hypothetical protein